MSSFEINFLIFLKKLKIMNLADYLFDLKYYLKGLDLNE